MSKQPLTSCRRCGTCCKKGGPILHSEDKPAVEQGLIPLKSLLTLRSGELVYDPVRETLAPVVAEVIKIKGGGQTWTCVYYDEQNDACRIYAHRPFECRLLKCWDTADFESVYQSHRLTRSDLISNVEGLWELVSDHEARCRYADVHALVSGAGQTKENEALLKLAEIVRYDIALRNLVVENGSLDPQILDFLFGRPLAKTLPAMYGLNIRLENGTVNISPNK
jgi:Fe-S-cluster containining protein